MVAERAPHVTATLPISGTEQVAFEPNTGHLPQDIEFVAQTPSYIVRLSRGGIAQFSHRAKSTSPGIEMEPVSSSGIGHGTAEQVRRGVIHYYRGNDSRKWVSGIPRYSAVRYKEVYPGIDLLYKGQQQTIEIEFQLAPRADARLIALRFRGAERLRIDPSGALLIETAIGKLEYRRPCAYQVVRGKRRSVPVEYRGAGTDVTFRLGRYDTSMPLIIDPVVTSSTYIGGSLSDSILGVVATSAGIYVVGETWSSDLIGSNRQPQNRDAFVTRLSPDGTSIVYTVVFGGGSLDSARTLTVDAAGNAYVGGSTGGQGFPVTQGAFRTAFGGVEDGYIARFTPTGDLAWATYLGGSATDIVLALALDSGGNVYATGHTGSTNFPAVSGAPQSSNGGGNSDAFLLKMNLSGTMMLYGTMLGGSGIDVGQGIAVNENREACIAGFTDSSDLPTSSPLQANLRGAGDALVACLNPAGTSWLWVTYLGGLSVDQASAIAFLKNLDLYVAGTTLSPDYPVANTSFGQVHSGDFDGFVTKLSLPGKSLLYSALLGGSRTDAVLGVAVDQRGHAFVAGYTASPNFPQRNSTQAFGGDMDGFLTILTPSGALFHSGFLGGNDDDRIYSISLTPSGTVLVGGVTVSENFPTTPGALSSGLSGGVDGFLTAFTIGTALTIQSDFDQNGRTDLLWQHDSSFDSAIWYLQGPQGTSVKSFAWLALAMTGWRLIGTADFDGNGTPDVIWQHVSTFDVALWHMAGPEGTHVQRFTWLSLGGGMAGWRLVAAADLDGNGRPDLIWQNAQTYHIAIWYMEGTEGTRLRSFAWPSLQTAPDWRLAAVADLDGNGRPDLIWQSDSTRQVAAWYMVGPAGNQVQSFVWLNSLYSPGWTVVGCADLDGNGRPDLIWQHDFGREVAVWYLGGPQGSQFQSIGWLQPSPMPEWRAIVR
jgi:hypothetical protein